MIFTAFRGNDGLGRVAWPGHEARAALGKGGLLPAADKREGDGASPIGAWPIRRVLYRPDRGEAPATRLPVAPIGEHDGWQQFKIEPTEVWCFDSRVDRHRHHVDVSGLDQDAGKVR